MAGSCEHGNESLGLMKCGEFDLARNRWRLTDYRLWNRLVCNVSGGCGMPQYMSAVDISTYLCSRMPQYLLGLLLFLSGRTCWPFLGTHNYKSRYHKR